VKGLNLIKKIFKKEKEKTDHGACLEPGLHAQPGALEL
jgi:hypothetical protein